MTFPRNGGSDQPTKGAGTSLFAKRRARRGRVADSLIGLSSLAIASVYAVGYLHTSAADSAGLLAGTSPAAASASATLGPPVPTPQVLTGRPPQSTATPRPAASVAPVQAAYTDGTFLGRGTSRHGDIEATVVINGGKIVSASVSTCLTRYSCSEVNALVREALQRQGVPVNHISGATDSSNAYKQAVAAALAKSKTVTR
jgi:uncharacterized protein with FMN-binding domain